MSRARIDIPAPDSRSGGLSLWIGFSLVVFLLSYPAGSTASPLNRGFFAFSLSIPILAMASRGHFGIGRWSFPTIPGQIYLIWNLGLLPSLAGAAFHSEGQYFYYSSAKWAGASAFLIWFLAFAVGSGRATSSVKAPEIPGFRRAKWRQPDLWSLFALVVIWMGCGIVASKLNTLSTWTQTNISDLQGSPEGAALITYWSFVPLIPVLGLSLLLFGQKRWRLLAFVVLTLGIAALVVYSNRRAFVYLGLLTLFMLNRASIQISFRRIGIAVVAIGLLMGPLLWPIRLAASRPELFSSKGHSIEMIEEAIVRYAEDPQFRDLVSEVGRENLQGGRFNYSDTFLAGVQWTEEHGPYMSPSFLYAPVIMTPSAIWHRKIEIADSLNIKRQFNQLGIANSPDFPMSPILEAVFEFGILGAAGFGFIWGLMAKGLDSTYEKASERLSRIVLWVSLYLGVLAFEAYISAFLVIAREAVLAVVGIWIFEWTLNRFGYIKPGLPSQNELK